MNISLQLSIYQSFLWRTTKYHCRWTSNYLRSIWNLIQCNICTKFNERLPIHIKFEHFIAFIYISVISMKNYQISLSLNIKLSLIYLKFELMQYMHQILSVLQIDISFEHFIAIVYISAISMKNYQTSFQ